MTSETVEIFMQRLQEVEQTSEVEPLVELFTEDAELLNLARSQPLQGQDGAHLFWQDYLSVFKHIRSNFTNVVEGNSTAILEWTSEGALSTGEPLRYRGISVIEINNGKVQRFRTYYDSAAFLPQGAKQ